MKENITQDTVDNLLSKDINERELVILESPYAGDIKLNVYYAQLCVRDSILRGESPMATHLLYTQPNILDDGIEHERELGIEVGLTWRKAASKTVVYLDLGISKGMEYGIKAAKEFGNQIEYRRLGIELTKDINFEIDNKQVDDKDDYYFILSSGDSPDRIVFNSEDAFSSNSVFIDAFNTKGENIGYLEREVDDNEFCKRNSNKESEFLLKCLSFKEDNQYESIKP